MLNTLLGAVFGSSSTATEEEEKETFDTTNRTNDYRTSPRSPAPEGKDPLTNGTPASPNRVENPLSRSYEGTKASLSIDGSSSTPKSSLPYPLPVTDGVESNTVPWRLQLDQFNARISQIYMFIAENQLESAVQEFAEVDYFITTVPFATSSSSSSSSSLPVPVPNSSSVSSSVSSNDPRQEMVTALRQRLTDYVANRMNEARAKGDIETVRTLWCTASTSLVPDTDRSIATSSSSSSSLSQPKSLNPIPSPSIFTSIFGEVVKTQFRDYVNETLSSFQSLRNHQLQSSLTIEKLDYLAQHDPYYYDPHYNMYHLPHPYLDRHLFTIIETAGVKMMYQGKSISFVQPHEESFLPTLPLTFATTSNDNHSPTDSSSYGITYSLSPFTIIPSPSENTPSMIVEVLTSILSEATIWMSQIMELDVPLHAKYPIIAILHTEVIEACLPLLQAYREDSQLDATLAIARTLLDYAENRLTNKDKGIRKYFEHQLEAIVHYRTTCNNSSNTNGNDRSIDTSSSSEIAIIPSTDTESSSSSSVSSPDISSSPSPPPSTSCTYAAGSEDEDPILITRFENSVSTTKKKNKASVPKYTLPTTPYPLEPSIPPSPPPSSYLPLSLPLSSSTGIIDETCDQLSYVCAILEKYLRYTTVSLGLGNGDQPSRTDDELSVVMHGLQGEYVLLERAYLENAIARAANTSKGWLPVAMSEDANVRTFAWVDMAFFILSKAIARACGTYCDMAAAAVINFVTNCLDRNIRKVINECIELCRTERKEEEKKKKKNTTKNGSDAVNPAELPTRRHNAYSVGDEAEEELARQLQQVLLGGKKSSSGGPTNNGSSNDNEQNSSLHDTFSNDNDDDEQNRVHEPAVAAIAIYACNTVHTASLFARSLYERTCGEVSAIFPLPYSEASGSNTEGNLSKTSKESTLSTTITNDDDDLPLPLCHPYLRVPLDTFRTIILGRDKNISLSFSSSPSTNDNQQGYNALLETAYAVLARTAGKTGFDQLHNLFSSSAAVSSSSSVSTSSTVATFAAFTGSKINDKVPTLRYVLNEQEYDTLTTTSTADVLLNIFHSSLLVGSGLSTLLSLLRQPLGTDMYLQALAKQLTVILQNGWISYKLPINEYGALLLAGELRDIEGRLSSYTRSGTTLVRKYFSYLEQCRDVWNLDALSDIYSLTFPVPLLSKEEIIPLLQQKVGLVKSNAALEAIQWEKVKCIKKS